MSRYIKEEDVIKAVDKHSDGEKMDEDISIILEEVPIADVAPVVYGEWIYNKISQLWECSACHEEEIRTTTYCPNCGAKMEVIKLMK